MRKIVIAFLLGLFVVTPASAQLRKDLAGLQSGAQVFQSGVLSKVFSPEHFRLSHSYELSVGQYGGMGGMTTGLYTANMDWNFGSKLDANLQVGALHTPFGRSTLAQQLMGNESVKLFVRNASLNYHPTKNLTLHMSFQQAPYATPYGYYNGYNPYYGGYQNGYAGLGWNSGSRFSVFAGTNTGTGY